MIDIFILFILLLLIKHKIILNLFDKIIESPTFHELLETSIELFDLISNLQKN